MTAILSQMQFDTLHAVKKLPRWCGVFRKTTLDALVRRGLVQIKNQTVYITPEGQKCLEGPSKEKKT